MSQIELPENLTPSMIAANMETESDAGSLVQEEDDNLSSVSQRTISRNVDEMMEVTLSDGSKAYVAISHLMTRKPATSQAGSMVSMCTESVASYSRKREREIEEEGYKYPPKNQLLKELPPPSVGSTSTKNRFNSLNNNFLLNEMAKAQNKQDAPKATLETPKEPAKPKIKPIVIKKPDNIILFAADLKSASKANFHVKPFGEYIRVFPETAKDHEILSKYCLEKKARTMLSRIRPCSRLNLS